MLARSTPPARVHLLHPGLHVVHCGSFRAVVTSDATSQRVMLWLNGTQLLRDVRLPTTERVAVRFARMLCSCGHRLACELAVLMQRAA